MFRRSDPVYPRLLQIQFLRHNVFCHEETYEDEENLTHKAHKEHWCQETAHVVGCFCAGHACGVHGTDGKAETCYCQDNGGDNLYHNVTYDVNADGSENLMIWNKAAHRHAKVHVEDHQERGQQNHDQQNPAEGRQCGTVIEDASQRRKKHGHKFTVGEHDEQGGGQNRQVDDGPQKGGQSL